MLNVSSGSPDSTVVLVAVWLFLIVLLAAAGCSGGEQALSEAQREKLDPVLRRILDGETGDSDLAATRRSDGAAVYAVLLRCTDPEALREAGLSLNTVQGSIVTARLTAEEIRTAATLEAVQRIEAARRNEPHQNPE